MVSKMGSLCLLIIFGVLNVAAACNEAICASVVSKCMLTQSCKCEPEDGTCYKECFSCLSYLYSECCGCVEMCPERNDTAAILSKKSYVEELGDGVPGLFSALTSEPDPHRRWLALTYAVELDLSQYAPEKEPTYKLQSLEVPLAVTPGREKIALNCTVAYLSQCMSCDKCRASCQSMGSSGYRWFHDGCCECIGDRCINYGINESKCLECGEGRESRAEIEALLEEDEDSLDYGEEQSL